jgi:hypothetical protein
MLQLEMALRGESALCFSGAIREATSQIREQFQQIDAQWQFLTAIFMVGNRYTDMKLALE